MIKKSLALVVFFLLITQSISYATVVGSDTAVSIQPAFTFPTADLTNQMLGFAAFTSGFTLADSLTSCTYNAFFPVGGSVQMNGGTLFLAEDLMFTPSLIMINAGSFFGAQKTMTLTFTKDFLWPLGGSSSSASQGATFSNTNDVITLDWSFDNNYLAIGDTAGNYKVLLQTGNTLTQVATNTTGQGSAESARWHPTLYYLAEAGTNAGGGIEELKIFQFTPGSNTFVRTDGRIIGSDVNCTAWRPQGDYLATGRQINAAELAVYPFNTSNGTLGAPILGDINPNATPQHDSLSWDPSGQYLAVGVPSNAGTELQIYYFDGANLTFTLGAEIGQQVNSVSYSPTGTFIAIGLNGSATRFRVYQHRISNGTLTLVNNFIEGTSVNSTHFRFDGNWIGLGRQDGGGGTDFRIYSFNQSTFALSEFFSVDTATNVNEVAWSPDGSKIATGDNNSMAIVYNFSSGGSLSANPVIFNNIKLVMSSNIIFRSPTIFQGNCIISGNNNTLGFDTFGSMIIDSGASVLCEQLTMTQVSNRITMVDTRSSLTLRDVTWELDGNFSFTQGYLNFDNQVYITARNNNLYKFTYSSRNQSLIKSYATLLMDNGITFSYDVPVASSNLFAMQDRTSIWNINGVTLHSTVTGMQLLKGTLRVNGTNAIESEAVVPAQGIQFGDGITAANDLSVELLAESGLNVTSGYLVYNNVNG